MRGDRIPPEAKKASNCDPLDSFCI
jgi:hypothetical protein